MHRQCSSAAGRRPLQHRAAPLPCSQRYLFQVQSLLEYDTAAGRPAANALDVYIQDAPVGLAVSSPTTVSLKDTASASWAKSLTAGAVYILRHQVHSGGVWPGGRLDRHLSPRTPPSVPHRRTHPRGLAHQIYSFNGMSFYSSENIAVRNVTLYSVPGAPALLVSHLPPALPPLLARLKLRASFSLDQAWASMAA